MKEYHELMGEMVIHGVVAGGKYKCNHCTVIRKNMSVDRPAVSEDGVPLLDCGCSRNKGVAEKKLVKMGIIGRVNNRRSLHSLSEQKWFKMDHVMGALFGYNTTWLLDPKIMKEGLLKVAEKIKL